MNPRPFYRSRIFWLGLPGLLFLLWGWKGCSESAKGIAWRHNDFAAFASTFSGEISVGKDNGDGRSQGYRSWNVLVDQPDSGPLAPEIIRDPSVAGVLIDLPVWLLLVGYLVTWLLTLALWQRRKARLLKLHAAL